MFYLGLTLKNNYKRFLILQDTQEKGKTDLLLTMQLKSQSYGGGDTSTSLFVWWEGPTSAQSVVSTHCVFPTGNHLHYSWMFVCSRSFVPGFLCELYLVLFIRLLV